MPRVEVKINLMAECIMKLGPRSWTYYCSHTGASPAADGRNIEIAKEEEAIKVIQLVQCILTITGRGNT